MSPGAPSDSPGATGTSGSACPTPPVDPASVQKPPRWPAQVAMLLGVACIVGAVVSWVQLADVRDARAAVRAQLEHWPVGEGGIPAGGRDAFEAVQKGEHDLRAAEATWGRRRLGLFLASLILVVGGFFASGLRGLYDKMTWVEVDPPQRRS